MLRIDCIQRSYDKIDLGTLIFFHLLAFTSFHHVFLSNCFMKTEVERTKE